MPYFFLGLLAIFLPLITYFSEKGWYKANHEAQAEKQKYIVLNNETALRQIKLDESLKVFSINNEKAIKEKDDFEKKQIKLDQDFKVARATLEKEFRDKFDDFNKDIKDKQDDIAKNTKLANQMLNDAKTSLQAAKALEEAAEKQMLKNIGDGETILKFIEDLKVKVEAISKNCDNHEKTDDPFFVDIIEKRIFENCKILKESLKASKDFNAKFNNKTLAKAVESAEAQLARAGKKVAAVNQLK